MRIPPDPTIPHLIYDPNKVNEGIKEMLRQQEFNEPLNAELAVAALETSFGKVFENGRWVRHVPYTQANWEGDGA